MTSSVSLALFAFFARFPAEACLSGRAADPDRSWVALGAFPRAQKPDHAHRQALGVLIKKMPVPRFQLYFFSPKPRFYFCELLWFWKWRRFLNFYPMKTISSRKSEVKSQVGCSQIRNELIETSPTSHRNLCFRVANSEIQLRAQSSLSGSAAHRRPAVITLDLARLDGP